MNTTRLSHIDFLRAVAIILIVVTHVFQYHLDSPLNKFIWNYSHFAVVLFIFCSVTVLLPSYEKMDKSVSTILSWYKKRLLRLIIPFYLYLASHIALIKLFPSIFTGNGLHVTPEFLFKSVTLTGGINFNWLVLLFIQIALMFPVIHVISKKRIWAIIFSLASLSFITATLFLPQLQPHSRPVMAIGWSLIVLVSIIIAQERLKPHVIFMVAGGMFTILFFTIVPSHTLINHKYPPDLFYLSYATMTAMGTYFISQMRVWNSPILQRLYTYISKHSYAIFFIHYIILDSSLRLKTDVWTHFFTVISITLVVTYLVNELRELLNTLLHSRIV